MEKQKTKMSRKKLTTADLVNTAIYKTLTNCTKAFRKMLLEFIMQFRHKQADISAHYARNLCNSYVSHFLEQLTGLQLSMPFPPKKNS